MGASGDCEAIVHDLLGQPVNSLTTIVFVVAGAIMLRSLRLRWLGVAMIATGVGSFLFHGPMPRYAAWAHDVTLAWLILVIAGLGMTWERWTRLPGLSIIAVILALVSGAGDALAVALTIAALGLLLWRDRSLNTIAPLGLITVTAILGRLGATGGPLCDPSSLWQWHGLWHVAAAVGVAWWAMTTGRRDQHAK